MKVRSMRFKEALQLVAFLLFFASTVALNLTCSGDENPVADSECGKGQIQWDEKGSVCRNLSENRIVPNRCCGR